MAETTTLWLYSWNGSPTSPPRSHRDRQGSWIRSVALEAAYHRAYATARVLPELQPHQRPIWLRAEADAVIAAIRSCRSDVEFPAVLDDFLIDLRVELAAFTHARRTAA